MKSRMPSGMPIAAPIPPEIKTMMMVSTNEAEIMLMS